VEARRRHIETFVDGNGREPFRDWLKGLRDSDARNRIRIKLNRVEAGNLGDRRSVGEGVQELEVDAGPGYRLYFGESGDDIILLAGGDKDTQQRDIRIAKDRWREYNAKENS
jgi:putative addiction module killer protein